MKKTTSLITSNPQSFTKALLEWYCQNARSLPWRCTSDPYAIWVSETMLQQTRVDTVIPYYQRFMAQYPTVDVLAQAPEPTVLKSWEGLGYYRRAKLLHQGAREVMTRYNGIFPQDPAQILALPGIGPYMAGAIASIAFNLPVPAVDGNVNRVATRQLAWIEPVETQKSRQTIAGWVQERFPPERAGDFTQSLMELGAMVCLPRNPHCEACPVSAFCQGQSEPLQYPVKKASRPIPAERRIALMITWQGRRLLRQRPDTGLMAGFWEYPHHLVDRSGHALDLAEEWTRHELGDSVEYRPFRIMKHVYSHLQWDLEVYAGEWLHPHPPQTPPDSNWFAPRDETALARVAFTRKLAPNLQAV